MKKILKKRPVVGFGLGFGLMGALLLAVRYAFRGIARRPLPDNLSPAIFSTKIQSTIQGEFIYHVSGEGQPVIFLHGIYVGASSFEWSRIYPEFAATHQVIVPDLVGFGESERPARFWTASDYTQGLEEFIRVVCDGKKPILIASGHSATFALYVASQHPDLVERLILYCPSCFLEDPVHDIMGGANLAGRLPGMRHFVYQNYLSTMQFIHRWLATVGYSDAAAIPAEVEETLLTCARQYRSEYAILSFLAGRLNCDLKERLAQIQQSVTIFWPGGDDRTMAEALKRSRQLPRSGFICTERGGFLAALETPDILRNLLKSELSGELSAQ
ncbi:MAG: alpha/beta hydrolase [Chthoniobacterales bacterium]